MVSEASEAFRSSFSGLSCSGNKKLGHVQNLVNGHSVMADHLCIKFMKKATMVETHTTRMWR